MRLPVLRISSKLLDLEDDAVEPAEVPEVPLLEVGVALVLEDGRQVLLGAVEDLLDLAPVEVGEADGPGQPGVHQLLHLVPGLHVVGLVVDWIVPVVGQREHGALGEMDI